MTRSGRGWAPFAEQVEGVTTYSSEPLHAVGFCDHTAQGFYSTLKSAAFWNNAGVSTHFGVARDGRVCQMVNLFETAWAQGRDSRGQPVGPTSPGVTWPPFAEMGKRNPNTYLISIEHEDAETVNGRTVFIPGSQWTEAQYQADLKLKRWCIEEAFRVKGDDLMRFGIDSLASHHMFDPVNRAECAGRFWRDEYHGRLFVDLAPAPDRVWAYGNERNGLELRGETHQVTWLGGIEVYAIGDPEGVGLGRIAKRFEDKPDGTQVWKWLRLGKPHENGEYDAKWSQIEGD